MVCPLLVVVVYVAFRSWFQAAQAEGAITARECKDVVNCYAAIQAARTYWTATLYGGTVVGLGTLAGAADLVRRARASITVKLGVVVGILLVLILLYSTSTAVSGWTETQLRLIQQASDIDMKDHLMSFLTLLFTTSWVLASAVALATYDVLRNGADIGHLIRTQRDIRYLLALATTWLIMGIVGIGALNRLALASGAAEFKLAITAVGAAAAVFSGVFYSALLAAIFGPAELSLRAAGRRLAEQNGSSAKDEDAWLKEMGFDLSVTQSLLRIMAVLSPMLAGLTQNIADLKLP